MIKKIIKIGILALSLLSFSQEIKIDTTVINSHQKQQEQIIQQQFNNIEQILTEQIEYYEQDNANYYLDIYEPGYNDVIFQLTDCDNDLIKHQVLKRSNSGIPKIINMNINIAKYSNYNTNSLFKILLKNVYESLFFSDYNFKYWQSDNIYYDIDSQKTILTKQSIVYKYANQYFNDQLQIDSIQIQNNLLPNDIFYLEILGCQQDELIGLCRISEFTLLLIKESGMYKLKDQYNNYQKYQQQKLVQLNENESKCSSDQTILLTKKDNKILLHSWNQLNPTYHEDVKMVQVCYDMKQSLDQQDFFYKMIDKSILLLAKQQDNLIQNEQDFYYMHENQLKQLTLVQDGENYVLQNDQNKISQCSQYQQYNTKDQQQCNLQVFSSDVQQCQSSIFSYDYQCQDISQLPVDTTNMRICQDDPQKLIRHCVQEQIELINQDCKQCHPSDTQINKFEINLDKQVIHGYKQSHLLCQSCLNGFCLNGQCICRDNYYGDSCQDFCDMNDIIFDKKCLSKRYDGKMLEQFQQSCQNNKYNQFNNLCQSQCNFDQLFFQESDNNANLNFDEKINYKNQCVTQCKLSQTLNQSTNQCENNINNCIFEQNSECQLFVEGYNQDGEILIENCKIYNQLENKCQQCNLGYKLNQESQCIQQCGDGYYHNGESCQSCPDNCKTCNETECLTCYQGNILQNQSCVSNQCGVNQIIIDDKCENCDYNCICQYNNLTKNTYCISCINQDEFLFDGKCLSKQEINQQYLEIDRRFISVNNDKIQQCSLNCQRCDKQTGECLIENQLIQSFSQSECSLHNCDICYLENSNEKCYKCSKHFGILPGQTQCVSIVNIIPNCQESFVQQNYCLKCDEGYTNIDGICMTESQCVYENNFDYDKQMFKYNDNFILFTKNIHDRCHYNCQYCNNNRSGGRCQQCQNHYTHNNLGYCVLQSSLCEKMNQYNQQCEICQYGYKLNDMKQCVLRNINVLQQENLSSELDQQCHDQYCQKCKNQKCLECFNSFVLQDNKCRYNCQDGYGGYNCQEQCIDNCNQCQNGKCIQCQSDFNLSYNGDFCYKDPQLCLLFDKFGNCLQCQKGFVIQNNIKFSDLQCIQQIQQ